MKFYKLSEESSTALFFRIEDLIFNVFILSNEPANITTINEYEISEDDFDKYFQSENPNTFGPESISNTILLGNAFFVEKIKLPVATRTITKENYTEYIKNKKLDDYYKPLYYLYNASHDECKETLENILTEMKSASNIITVSRLRDNQIRGILRRDDSDEFAQMIADTYQGLFKGKDNNYLRHILREVSRVYSGGLVKILPICKAHPEEHNEVITFLMYGEFTSNSDLVNYVNRIPDLSFYLFPLYHALNRHLVNNNNLSMQVFKIAEEIDNEISDHKNENGDYDRYRLELEFILSCENEYTLNRIQKDSIIPILKDFAMRQIMMLSSRKSSKGRRIL